MNAALIVIDMQRDFCSPGGYADAAGMDVQRLREPVAHIQQLLKAARAAGLLVVHTREGHLPDLSDCPPAKLARSVAAGAAIGSQGPLGRLLVRGEQGHDFIEALKPHWAVVQAAYLNRYGHPSPQVIQRYESQGVPLSVSSECGAAYWQSTQPQQLNCEREVRRRYWHTPRRMVSRSHE